MAGRARTPAHQPPERSGFEGASILSFAVDRWDDVPRCRHHVLSRLAASNRVLFVSPPNHIREVFRHPPSDAGRLKQVSTNLFTYVPPRWLPYTYGYPLLNRLFAWLRNLDVRRRMRQLGMRRPILYIWHPFFADVVGRFGEKLVVYHCYDEYAAFSGSDRARVVAQERRVLEAAAVVFAVSEGLCQLKAKVNSNTHLVRNAVDYDLFASAQNSDLPLAPELANIPRPVIGCVTRIVPEYFDARLLREIFVTRPDWSLVVVGPASMGTGHAAEAFESLKALPNVHLLGRREFRDLPSYIKGFDACVIPYVLSENKLLADPLKLYEYLAAGKPIISKPLPLLTWMGDMVGMADGVDEWIAAIDSAIRTDSAEKIARRQELARANTWDERVQRIRQAIADVEAMSA
jgi:glycosyltransferase involved in cell wall biosynthesis